jgi:VanZ family protein
LVAKPSYPKKLWLIALGLVAYGGLLEALQSLSSGWTPNILDASADWSGAILSVVAMGFSTRWLNLQSSLRK